MLNKSAVTVDFPVTKIRKRNGYLANFNAQKIISALYKAFVAGGQDDLKEATKVGQLVMEKLRVKFVDQVPGVEDIQDLVEEALLEGGYVEVGRSFIAYRQQHAQLREVGHLINSNDLMEGYLGQVDWMVRENSNMAFSLQGLHVYISSGITSRYWLNKIYTPEISDAHSKGDLHLHDLGILAAYCCGWNLRDLLTIGFGGVSGKISCCPPRHLTTALGQLVNFLFTLQMESAGAQAVSNFDTYLAPYVRKDNLSYKQVKQAIQGFIFNLNVPTRVGFQTPFTNITLDLIPPRDMANESAMIGTEPQDFTYGDLQEEMNLINEAFTEVMSTGDSDGRVFTFPIPTYNITKDFDWDNPRWNSLWKMTAKFGIPYFSNFINSDMDPSDARSMCLSPKEEVIIRNSKKIKRFNLGQLVEEYKVSDFDAEGWAECKMEKNLQMLSLNFETGKTEWANVVRFLKVKDDKLIKITAEDGKKIEVSAKHLIPVLTPFGLINKFAQDIKEGDYLLNLRRARKSLNQHEQKVGIFNLNRDLAKILGYFTADGNYLFENRKNMKTFGRPRGLQFTFNAATKENLQEIKDLIAKVFQTEVKEKKDPRYNSYYLYVYNTLIARELFDAGFKKYGRLPNVLFNSPIGVIKSFLDYHFKGDGYKERKEIHINDKELAHDLVMLYSLAGLPVTYRERKSSQVIYLQHKKSKTRTDGILSSPLLFERVPGFLAKSTYAVPGLNKSRMVGYDALKKYQAHTSASRDIQNSDYYITRVKNIEKQSFDEPQTFFDVELDKNHLFVHSLGTITHNCCRLRLDNRELRHRGGGLFGANPLTGSIGVVSINMPRIGYLSDTKEDFFKRLGHLMDLSRDSLEIKRKVIERFTEAGLYPYSRIYLEGMKQRFGQYWKNHFNTIGLIGMNEALLNFMDKDIASSEGHAFALEVLDFMRDKLTIYQKETGNLYNLEATPGEGLSPRLARLDKQKYPQIIVANEQAYLLGNSPFYSNSSQLPVDYTDDLFAALEMQDELQTKYTGGTVFHGFLGEAIDDIEATKNLVRKIAENFKMPYYTLTPTFSICPEHGYLKGKQPICPHCQKETEVYSRVVGYLRPIKQWNDSKQAEFEVRKVYKL